MYRSIVAIGLFLAMPSGHAKCVSTPIEISGELAAPDGTVLAGASVSVAWIERGEVHGPLLAITNDAGQYLVRFWFNTYTKGGFLSGDVCRGRLKVVALGFPH